MYLEHGHYCEESLLFGKRGFSCPKRVKFKNAGHEDCCDLCNRFITIWWDKDNKIVKFTRMTDEEI